jgi:transcriptional regulator GlxA family with amidase domain
MKHLTILVPEGENNLSSIVGSYKIMTRANQYCQSLGKMPVFDIQLAGISERVDFHGGLFSVHPIHVNKIKKTDLIIIPSLNHNFETSIVQNTTLIKWIKNRYSQGSEVASICTGAFMLASTGLLDGRKCSTHWVAYDAFKKMFPEVNLVYDKVITDEHGIYTNGGAFSFLNLILYLVEKYFDRKTAIYCSKVFQIDLERNSQSPFSIFSGLKEHEDEEIKRAQILIEKSVQKKLNIEEVSSKFAVGRRSFDRRFKKVTGETPIQYFQRVKVEAAKRSLETSSKSIFQVMSEVGYADIKAFRMVFKKITGLSPIDYRKRFNKQMSKKVN